MEYQANCADELSTTRVTVGSESEYSTRASYELIHAPASGTKFNQYIQLGVPSAVIPLQTGENKFSIRISIPKVCQATYTVTVNKQPSSGFVVGDPQFAGLRGQMFQVHGVSGEIYNIISDRHVQVNARFVYLNAGSCPIIDGRRAHGCWSHPGSYLGEIGIKTSNGDRIRILSGHAKEGFEEVTINDRQLPVGATIELPCPEDGHSIGFITMNTTHLVTIEVSDFRLELENSDLFINQRVVVTNWENLHSHGLLGQTWRRKVYPNSSMKYIEGKIDDYVVRGRDLFGDEFIYNQFRDLTREY